MFVLYEILKNRFLTKKNIDNYIEYAVENVNKDRKLEIQIVLIKYKDGI